MEEFAVGAQSGCQVPHTPGVWCDQPFWMHSLGDVHLAAEGHIPKEKEAALSLVAGLVT